MCNNKTKECAYCGKTDVDFSKECLCDDCMCAVKDDKDLQESMILEQLKRIADALEKQTQHHHHYYPQYIPSPEPTNPWWTQPTCGDTTGGSV